MRAKISNILSAVMAFFMLTELGKCSPGYQTCEKTVSYDGGAKQITYLEAGSDHGPLIILLHGWPAVAETWKHQIDHLAKLGYRVVSPDMPGYGKSTANLAIEDYAHENVIVGLLAMLANTKRSSAIWVSHDWGAGVASSLVATHPEVVDAMAWLGVPYKTLELGLQELLRFVNRTTYPPELYPYGQWEYMRYYEEQFDRAASVFESDIGYALKNLYSSAGSNDSIIGTRPPFAQVRIDGGFFSGVDHLPPADTLSLNTTLLDEDLYKVLLSKLSATGFGPPDAYYMNHARNRAYNLQNQKNKGYVNIPCLFIQAKYDIIVDTVTSDLLSPMPEYCKNFSFATLDTGHWIQLEDPNGTNYALEKWLREKVPQSYPGNQHC